jgi:hypothetical protein
MRHARGPPPIARPSCTSPGFTQMKLPGPASTWPRPLHEAWPRASTTPTPYWSCVCRGNARAVDADIASMPASGKAWKAMVSNTLYDAARGE